MYDWASQAIERLHVYVTDSGFVFAPVYVLSSLALGGLYWLLAKPDNSLLLYLFPREIYRHPSTKADVGIATVNILFVALGGVSFIVIAPIIATLTVVLLVDPTGLGDAGELGLGWGIVLIALLVLAEDLARYLVHRAHHESSVLWPFHAVHHSAQVMTPLTFFRAHPAYYLTQKVVISILTGLSQGLIVAAAFQAAPAWIFLAAMFISRLYMAFGLHLRHSHIPLSYGRLIEHVVISPRLHQVHHSIDPRHYDKNFGEIFAIWDWAFGTLCIPEPGETFEFGLIDDEGHSVHPHPTLTSAMIVPFRESARVIARRTSREGKAVEAS